MEAEKGLQVLGHKSPRQIRWREKRYRPSRLYPLRTGVNPTRNPLYLVLSLITIEPLLLSMSPDQMRRQPSPKSQKRNWE